MTEQAAATQAVVDAIGQVTFGTESTFENLSIVALLRLAERDADYLTLDEALAGGWAQITEVNEAGEVSALKVVVNGAAPVLLLDGEELVGAKQNRVVNLTIMAPPQRTTVIPFPASNPSDGITCRQHSRRRRARSSRKAARQKCGRSRRR